MKFTIKSIDVQQKTIEVEYDLGDAPVVDAVTREALDVKPTTALFLNRISLRGSGHDSLDLSDNEAVIEFCKEYGEGAYGNAVIEIHQHEAGLQARALPQTHPLAGQVIE